MLFLLLCYLLLNPLQGSAFSDQNLLPVVSQGRIHPYATYQQDEEYFVLPTHGDWLPIETLANPSNHTAYSDETYQNIRAAYLLHPTLAEMAPHLLTAYKEVAGTVYRQAYGKALLYPTELQLKAEVLYFSFPWIPLTTALYLLAAIGLALALTQHKWLRRSMPLLFFAFILHTSVLLLRCYILSRPPVSNMFETVVYVPWIAVLASFFFRRGPILPLAASLVSIILLTILQITKLNEVLQPIQPVLDSQFWLIIHVLMVVGSYGTFLLVECLDTSI